MNLLIIDDEPDFTDLMSTLLGFHGFTVASHNDPLTVLPALRTTPHQIIVTDLMMPRLDGFGLIRAIRHEATYAATPIIALSAKMLTDAERTFLLQHHVHFVMKPFEPNALVEHILQLTQEPPRA